MVFTLLCAVLRNIMAPGFGKIDETDLMVCCRVHITSSNCSIEHRSQFYDMLFTPHQNGNVKTHSNFMYAYDKRKK